MLTVDRRNACNELVIVCSTCKPFVHGSIIVAFVSLSSENYIFFKSILLLQSGIQIIVLFQGISQV